MFAKAGFARVTGLNGTSEDVYEFPVKEMFKTSIVVYSTIVNGVARGNGADAIRVMVLYSRDDGQARALLKEGRVNRTGEIEGIVSRTLLRMRHCFTELRDRERRGLRCSKCGAPLFTSKAGNEVCVETCWVKT
jgi:hypothetical protein